MKDILGDFMVIESFIIIMNGDTLPECLMDGLAENVIEMRFTAEDQGKAVQGIIACFLSSTFP